MTRKVFTSQKISIFLGGTEFSVQTLVSTFGAKYVFDDHDLPPEARFSLGLEVHASYKGIAVKSRFVRETNPAGSIYSLRFVNPTHLLVRQIERDLAVSGLPSPWMRGLARIGTTAKHLPAPVLAMVTYGSGTFYMNVRNFTLGGLLVEYSGSELGDVSIGTRLSFDLVTNGGDKFTDISGSVTHISAELNNSQLDSCQFQFGLKFSGMSAVTELRYRGLIREHCLGLRDTLDSSASAI